MPLPTQDCEVTPDVCCFVVFDIANYILNTVYDGLIDCIPSCGGQTLKLHKYVTLGIGDDAVVDSLTVAFQGAIPSPGSTGESGKQLQVASMRGTYEVRLRESGWPIVRTDGGKLNAPDPVMQHAMAQHAYAHGEKVFRILRGLRNGPWLSGYPKPAYCSIGGFYPMNPLGGTVGWVATLTVDLPFGQQGL